MELEKVITVFLADECRILRQSLSALLHQQDDLHVVGQTGTVGRAVSEVFRLRPEVTVMDIGIWEFNGIEATARIKEGWPEAKVLALTMHNEEDYLLPFLEAGGCGYIHKSADSSDLIRAIRMAALGQVFIRPEALKVLTMNQTAKKERDDSEEPVLSERETQVLSMVARGYTSKEIGEALYLAHSTVETYRVRLMRKLDITTRAQLVDYAVMHNMFRKTHKGWTVSENAE